MESSEILLRSKWRHKRKHLDEGRRYKDRQSQIQSKRYYVSKLQKAGTEIKNLTKAAFANDKKRSSKTSPELAWHIQI